VFVVLTKSSKPVILDCGNAGILAAVKTGICPSVNPVNDAPEPLNNVAAMVPLTSNFCAGFLPIPKLLLFISHIKFADCVIGFVSFPIKSCPSAKVDKPVPPRATANVPALILLAFKFVNCAPEPLNKLAVIVPLAFMSVVSIPPRAYKIPLKVVLILLEYA
jgi:hypothetical protein